MNQKKYALIVLLVSLRLFAIGQNKAPMPKEQEYYDFFNSFINPDSIRPFNLSESGGFENGLSLEEIYADGDFTPQDTVFIKQQLAATKNFKWTEGKIKGAKIIPAKEINGYFHKGVMDGWGKYYKHHTDGFSKFSVPIFSPDKTKCIVYRGGHCGGLCGGGCIYVYIKVNGKWTVKKVYDCWVS